MAPRSDVPTPDVLAEHPRPVTGSTVGVPAGEVPGPRTPFVRADASGGMVLHDGRPLEPSTVYDVEGRGRFYTDADGKVVRVETTAWGGNGLNPDLQRTLPGVEYVVNGDTVFRTDELARTVEMDARGLGTGEGVRSKHTQGLVGADGRAQYPGRTTKEVTCVARSSMVLLNVSTSPDARRDQQRPFPVHRPRVQPELRYA